MKKIFVFIGKPMTGKSTLANMCRNENTKIFDEINLSRCECRFLIQDIKRGRIDCDPYKGWKTYDNYILVCHNENSENLLNELAILKNDFNISVVRFEQL